MSTTVTVSNGQEQTYTLPARVAQIVEWVLEQADVIAKSPKGKIEVDYAGKHLVIHNTQIVERESELA